MGESKITYLIKQELIDFIFKSQFYLNSQNILEFSHGFNQEIQLGNISNKDAMYIICELLFTVNENCIKTHINILDDVSRLKNEVRELNEQHALKSIFNKDYSSEVKLIEEYFNSINDTEKIYYSNLKNSIKTNLNHFSKKELCEILELEPELTFDKEKKLRNKIADILLTKIANSGELSNCRVVDVKKLIESDNLINKFSKVSTSLTSSLKEIKTETKNFSKGNIDDDYSAEIHNKEIQKTGQRGIHSNSNKIHGENVRVNSEKSKDERRREVYLKWHIENQKKNQNKTTHQKKKRLRKKKKLAKDSYERNPQKSVNKNSIITRQNTLKRPSHQDESSKNTFKEQNDLKNELRKIRFKVHEFNSKNSSEIVSSKNEYLEIYNKIKHHYFNIFANEIEIDKFSWYFEHDLNGILEFNNGIEEYIPTINELYSKLGSCYLSKSKRECLFHRYENHYSFIRKLNSFPKHLKEKLLKENNLMKFKKFYEDLKSYSNINDSRNTNMIRIINEKFIKDSIEENNEFFEDIDDPNKRKAIVIDEDNVRVVAGAGTGKTFTIQNRVKYLIEIEDVPPEKILCLCFTRKSANQLNKRVNKHLDDEKKVAVYTFHEFARLVDTECGGEKSTNRYLLDSIIRNHIKLMINDSKKADKLLDYFSYYKLPSVDKKQFNTQKELEEYEKKRNLVPLREKYYFSKQIKRTLKDEVVRSQEELEIANYLFLHDINYEYEKPYPYNWNACMLKKRFLYSGNHLSMEPFSEKSNETIINESIIWFNKLTNYHPDFYLTDYDIYLEHFGVNENCEAVWLTGYEKAKYEKGMKSKILWHKSCGTKLIKTYSSYHTKGVLREKLESILRKNYVTIGQRDHKEILDILFINSKLNDYKLFTDLVKSFINIFEAKNLPKEEFDKFKQKNLSSTDIFNNKRQEIFFDIATEIYDKYYNHNQGDDIDHNREISNALELIENNKFKGGYEYILIDEYQDINYVRCKLIQELQKSCNSKLFVVGDDWQSIYGFNGSQVKLFKNFDEYFPNSETIKLEETRRNSQKINSITRKFIMKNWKNQEDKKLRYYKNKSDPNPIRLVDYKEDYPYQKILRLDAILQDIIKSNPSNPKILILGRKNDDILDYINNSLFIEKRYGKYRKIIYSKKRNLDITFMSVHQSKGLECDEVIILNVSDEILGFPSQIEDDPIINLIKDTEDYPFAEERRLFYVALTRTKNRVYILYPKSRASEFVKELNNDFRLKKSYLKIDYGLVKKLYDDEPEFFEKIERYPTEFKCPECGEGNITIVVDNHNREGRRTQFVGCSEYPDCDYLGGTFNTSLDNVKYVEPCPSCKGIMVRQGDVLKCSMNYFNGCLEMIDDFELDEEDLKYSDFED